MVLNHKQWFVRLIPTLLPLWLCPHSLPLTTCSALSCRMKLQSQDSQCCSYLRLSSDSLQVPLTHQPQQYWSDPQEARQGSQTKTFFIKTAHHPDSRSAGALRNLSAWPCRVCYPSGADTYVAVSSAAANSAPEHTGIAGLVGHESF